MGPGKFLPAHIKWARIRDAAACDTDERPNVRALAYKWGVEEDAVRTFISRHSVKIGQVREDVEGEFAGMWAAKRANRVATLQETVDLLEEQIQELRETEGLVPDKLVRLMFNGLQQIAEQTGQLQQRVAVSGTEGQAIQVTLEGVDTDDLS